MCEPGIKCAIVILWCALLSHLAPGQSTSLSVPITVTDGVTGRTLFFGLDPIATEGLDSALGESELPPLPPSGVFDARFIGHDIAVPLGNGTLKDFRKGNSSTIGSRIHELLYQRGAGSTITLSWVLPPSITGRLQDIVLGSLIDVGMQGTGDYTVSNPSVFNKLKLTVSYSPTAAIRDQAPDVLSCVQIYPNPFNVWTVIQLGLRKEESVTMKVFDALGREVSTLVDGRGMMPGLNSVLWDATSAAAGMYFIRFQIGPYSSVKKMILLK